MTGEPRAVAPSPEIIFFDIGDTIAHPHPSFQEIILRVCQLDRPALTLEDVRRAEAEVFALADERAATGRTYSTSAAASREFWHWIYGNLLQRMGVAEAGGLPEQLYQEFLKHENYRLFPDAVPALGALQDRGYRLAVISNWEDWLERLLFGLQVDRFFEFTIISGTAGVEKPDRRIFELALARAAVGPDRAVHVGDNPRADVRGAEAAGLIPVLVDRQLRHQEIACLRVQDLRELPALLVPPTPPGSNRPTGGGAAPARADLRP